MEAGAAKAAKEERCAYAAEDRKTSKQSKSYKKAILAYTLVCRGWRSRRSSKKGAGRMPWH